MNRDRALNPTQRIAKAKQQLAAGSPDYAQAHALVALAESIIDWLATPNAEPPDPEPIFTGQGDSA